MQIATSKLLNLVYAWLIEGARKPEEVEMLNAELIAPLPGDATGEKAKVPHSDVMADAESFLALHGGK